MEICRVLFLDNGIDITFVNYMPKLISIIECDETLVDHSVKIAFRLVLMSICIVDLLSI